MFQLTAQGDTVHQLRKGRHGGRGEVWSCHLCSQEGRRSKGREEKVGGRLAIEAAQVSLASRPAPSASLP